MNFEFIFLALKDKDEKLPMQIVLIATFLPLIGTPLMVLYNLDPLYIFNKMVFHISFLRSYDIIPSSHFLVIIFRIVIFSVASLVSFAGPRTVILIAMSLGPLNIYLFQRFSLRKLDKQCLLFYQQMYILFIIGREHLRIYTAVLLSSTFFVIVASANSAILQAGMENYLFSILSGSYAVIVVILLLTLLHVGCIYYYETIKLITSWSNKAVQIRDGGYIRRVVKSFQVMAIPVANVGIIDKEIQGNYMDNVLNYTISVMMMVNDLVK